MPAQNLSRINTNDAYCHVYNRGTEGRIIFNDEEDYRVFLGYLKDYLTAPAHPEATKKAFSIKGRIFQGIPHQPKNYFSKVELIAYSLMPNHFHLLMHQKTRDSLERFIRSLCTRYSMYFNKKYQRSGALFEGPYKSVQIKDVSRALLHLTRHIHRHGNNDYSSYPEYLGQRETSWVKTKVILSRKGADNYKYFVEKYEPDQKEKELLEGVTLESKSQDLEGGDHTSYFENYPEPLPRLTELLVITAVFLLLVGLGVRNIKVSTAKSHTVLSESVQSTASPTPAATPKSKTMVVVKITDGSASVNIRQNPTINSEKIGEAKDGETFEFVAVNSRWYEIKLADGSTGFILSSYAQLEGANN